jgi:hypothetical protein
VSRAEMAVLLGRAAHPAPFLPAPPQGLFADVPRDFWAASWIEQAYRDGLSTGCQTTGTTRTFCPASPATRAEAAVFLVRARRPGFTPPPPTGLFSDVPVFFWAAPWIEQLYRDGITAGCSASGTFRLFCPTSTVTRAEMAVWIVRSFHLEQVPTPLSFTARLCSAASCSYPAGMPIDFALEVTGGIPSAYDFDWNGDGTYEETALFPKAHVYPAPGQFRPQIRLRRGSSSRVLAHPRSITVLAASYGTPSPPSSFTLALEGLQSPKAIDPPGTASRSAYRLSTALQPTVLGYAAFVNSGAGYEFVGLLEGNRLLATDRLLVLPASGAVRYVYLRAFNATGYGPSSLPARLP